MVFLSFIMSIFIGIQDPIIQKFAIRIAGGYVSSKTGADVQIGRLYISPNFTIHIDHFLVKDLRDNNILKVEHLKVRPIMEDLVHGNIHVGRVELDDAEANLITYQDSTHMNFQFLIDAFASGEKKKKSDKPVVVAVDHILLKDLDFQLWNQNIDDTLKTAQGLMDYAHLAVDDIHLDMRDLHIVGDSITAMIHHLAAVEASGFTLNDFVTDAKVSPSGILLDSLFMKTPNSNLHLDLHMLFNDFSDISHFVDSVRFDTRIYPTELLLSDIGPFTSVLYQMPDRIVFEGMMRGPVSDFTVDDLILDLGDDTHFEGSVTLRPLDMNHSTQFLNIRDMDFTFADLAAFYIPSPTKTIPIPASLVNAGQGNLRGKFSGSFTSFKTNLELISEIGNLNASLTKHVNEHHYNVLEGTVEASRVNAGLIANAPDVIGTLDMTATVIGRQQRHGGMDLDIDGVISDAQLLGNVIDEVSMNGNLRNRSFNGKISVDDEELVMDFNGRFDFSDPKSLGGDFQADIAHADLHQLNLIKDDPVAQLKGSVTANMSSINNFNNAEGSLLIDGVRFTNSRGDFNMEQLTASIANDNLLMKRIDVNSDFFDFEMAGQMDFTTLVTAFKQFVYSYVEIPQWTASLEQFEKSKLSSDQDFIINLNLKNPKPVTNLLMPTLSIAKNTTLSGTFTSRSKLLNLTLRSKQVKINNIRLNNIDCRTISSPRLASARLNMEQIILRDSTAHDTAMLSLDQFKVSAMLQNDSIKAGIFWDDFGPEDHTKAKLHASFVPSTTGGRINIGESEILLSDSFWTINPNNFVEFNEGRIQISDLELVNKPQRLSIDGFVPMQADDTLAVALNQFDVSTFDFLFKGMGFDADGFITGSASMSNLKEDPTVIANLGIKDLGVNGERYGDAKLFSQWNNETEAIDLSLGLLNEEKKVIDLLGSFYTGRKEDNLDFKANVDGLSIGILSPFLSNIVQRLQGLCTGVVTVKGSLNEPDIQGTVSIKDGGCKVNFLNTFYTFSPTISLSEGLIDLNTFTLVDTLGNSALVTGKIRHQHLKDMALDIKMYPNNFLAMATTADDNSSFYGTAIANGIVEVFGPTNDLRLSIKAATRRGTSMTIPIGGTSSVQKHEFITFVNNTPEVPEEEEAVEVEKPKKKNNAKFGIDMDLDVNNDAQVKIALPNGLGSMEAKGEGNIKLGVGSASALTLIGDYVIGSGSLALNIQNVLKRNFSLEPGSSISWTGDPVNGTINATGVYQTKASLSSLGLADSTSTSSSNINVDCMVHLKNQLLNPDISFSLRLPKASEDLQQAVFNVIDTTNQSEVLLQAVYLMLTNSFNYGGSSGGNYYGLITSQLNDFMAEIVNDVDININYKPGSQASNEEMTVAMKKQLFDERLTIETNFGVIIPTNAYASNSTNIVGDFNIDYKITKDGRLSGQVFNRSNYNTTYYQYSYYKMAPYTQGIGISYSKSFDRFKELFKRRNPLNPSGRPVIQRPNTPTQGNNDHDESNNE